MTFRLGDTVRVMIPRKITSELWAEELAYFMETGRPRPFPSITVTLTSQAAVDAINTLGLDEWAQQFAGALENAASSSSDAEPVETGSRSSGGRA